VEIDEDWCFTLVDERAQQIYDMSEEELLGKHFWDVLEAGQGTVFEKNYRQVMETREPLSFEAFYDGTNDDSGLVGWFEVHVYPEEHGGIAFYFRDVSERKWRERRTEGLNEMISRLMKADSREEVCGILVGFADSELYLPIAVTALLDEEEGRLRSVRGTELAGSSLAIEDLLVQDGGGSVGRHTSQANPA
jgi:PAS domain S-box-containing protein